MVCPLHRRNVARGVAAILAVSGAFAVSVGGAFSGDEPMSNAGVEIGLPVGLVDPATEARTATFVAFTEGPAVDAAGSVFFSDIRNNRIMKLAPGGELVAWGGATGA